MKTDHRIASYWQTGQAPRLPTALLSVGIMLSAVLSLVCGTVLHTVTLGRQEPKRLAGLAPVLAVALGSLGGMTVNFMAAQRLVLKP